MCNYYKKIIVLGGICSILLLSGCNKAKVTMITGDKTTQSSEETIITQEEYSGSSEDGIFAVTEEAGEQDKSITLNDIYSANRGDMLLQGRSGYSATTAYFSSGTQIYEETEYIGFDEDGNYFQGYENSKGHDELLDIENQCWYVLNNGEIKILIYPEDGVADIMIDVSHNGLVYSLPDEDEQETITDVYRQDGSLVVITKYISDLSDSYTRKFILDDEYRILDIFCYDEKNELYSHTRTTENSIYNVPDEIADIIHSTRKRTIGIVYSMQDGIGNTYEVPSAYEVYIKLFARNAYSDAEGTIPWQSSNALAGDYYVDEVIYLAE